MKFAILTGFIFLTFSTTAQDPHSDYSLDRTNLPEVRYCAMLKDGKMILMKDNVPVVADIELKDGSSISKDGTLRRKDGTKISLGNGECVDANGTVFPRKVNSEKKGFENDEPAPDKHKHE